MINKAVILAVALFGIGAITGSTEANVTGAMSKAVILDASSASQVVEIRHRHHRQWRRGHHRHWGHRHHRRWGHRHYHRHLYFGYGIRFGHRHHRWR